jgi:hypothetical protein
MQVGEEEDFSQVRVICIVEVMDLNFFHVFGVLKTVVDSSRGTFVTTRGIGTNSPYSSKASLLSSTDTDTTNPYNSMGTLLPRDLARLAIN